MKYIKSILKILLGIIVLLTLVFFVVKTIYSKDLPQGQKGPEADQMAQKMLKAINFNAFDTLPYMQWSFRGEHHFVYNKANNTARISWDDNEVHLKMDEIKGVAKVNGQEVTDDLADKLVQKAWSHWCNDSFWFNAPSKVFDTGTERSIVTNGDGSKSLLVTYSGGGVTPGDSYLWHLDEDGLPNCYQMWTKIIPIGGISSSWDNWVELPNGAKISSFHNIGGKMPLEIKDIKGGFSWSDLGFDKNPIQI
ncbi:MAG: hypothetical protein V3V00_03680 [Saprospiraceae bacterium]